MATAPLPTINPQHRSGLGLSINRCEQAGQIPQTDEDLKFWFMADCRFPGPHHCVTQDGPQDGGRVAVGDVSKVRTQVFIQPRYLMGKMP